MSQINEIIQVRALGTSTNERVDGCAEHAKAGAFAFRIGIAPEPDPVCMAGGRIRMMRVEKSGHMHYLYANGARRLHVHTEGLEAVIAELRRLFN